MKLFSWFIKINNSSNTQKENTLDDELNTFNSNTMWPIAKVKTTTMMMKKPVKKEVTSSNVTLNSSKIIAPNLSLVIIP